MNPDHRGACCSRSSAARGLRSGSVRCGLPERVWQAPHEIFFYSRGFGFLGCADLWRGLAVLPRADPVPECGGEEPKILAVIPGGLAALCIPDPAADP